MNWKNGIFNVLKLLIMLSIVFSRNVGIEFWRTRDLCYPMKGVLGLGLLSCCSIFWGLFFLTLTVRIAGAETIEGFDDSWQLIEGHAYWEQAAIEQDVLVVPPFPEGAIVEKELQLEQNGASTVYSFLLNAPVQPLEQASALFDLNGAQIGFVNDSGLRRIYVFDATNGGQWLPTEFLFDPGIDYGWMRLGIIEDSAEKTWSLYGNGTLLASGLALEAPTRRPDRFYLFGDDREFTYLSGFSAQAEEVDVELEEQIANESYPKGSLGWRMHQVAAKYGQKYVFHGGRLMSLRDVLLEQIHILGSDFLALPSRSLIFVDNSIGDDRFTGAIPELKGRKGPKKTMTAAFRAVSERSLIIVFEGNGIYDEQVPDDPEGQVTWLHLGDGVSGDLNSIEAAMDAGVVKRTFKRRQAFARLTGNGVRRTVLGHGKTSKK